MGATTSELARDRVVFLRRMVVLEDVPPTAPMRAFADGRYVLFVNGSVVTRGPARDQPRRNYYDQFELRPGFGQGKTGLQSWFGTTAKDAASFRR